MKIKMPASDSPHWTAVRPSMSANVPAPGWIQDAFQPIVVVQ
jgi:hypothetical protein